MNEAEVIYNYLKNKIPGIEVLVGYGSEFDKDSKTLAKKRTKRKLDKCHGNKSLVSPVRGISEIKWKKSEDQYDCLALCQDVKESFLHGLIAFPECRTSHITEHIVKHDSEELTRHTNVIYMTYVYVEPLKRYIKIGFCDYINTLDSMITFKSQYIPFRMTKKLYVPKSTPMFDDALMVCRTSFDIVAGLLTPELTYPLAQHFDLVYGASYNGDHRNGIAEDAGKVGKLIRNQEDYVDSQYGRAAMYERELHEYTNGERTWLIHKTIPNNWYSLLPEEFQTVAKKTGLRTSRLATYEDRKKLADAFNSHINKRNKLESFVQPVRGELSTGTVNTVAYGLRKLGKAQCK